MEAKMREEVDREIEEEFSKYLKEERAKHPLPKKKFFDWYKCLALFITGFSILAFVYSMVSLLSRK